MYVDLTREVKICRSHTGGDVEASEGCLPSLDHLMGDEGAIRSSARAISVCNIRAAAAVQFRTEDLDP
jgi:hypothetical protein